MSTIGQLIKGQRHVREWSLRHLAKELGVTAAYVSDLEADKRLPSAELRERIASVLGIPAEELTAADSRLSPELRKWIEKRPQLTNFLRALRSSPDSDLLIQRLTRLIQRRLRPQPRRGVLVTWESELRAIGAEASAWSVETGGDLFGRWQDVPTIFLATKAGPEARRDHTHFRLDVEYLRRLSELLASTWGLRYFGDWHSHHRLGLSSPSTGDRRRIVRIAGRNQFSAMSEIIVTLEDDRNEPGIRIHPWIYNLAGGGAEPFPSQVRVLPGLSPVREALLATRALPEQELFSWEKLPFRRLRIGSFVTPPRLEPMRGVDTVTHERALSHLIEALQDASGGPVEQHSTGFGSIIVAELRQPNYLAFALGSAWPMSILEVHRLNREVGTTEPITAPTDLVALDIPGVLEVFRKTATALSGMENHVEN